MKINLLFLIYFFSIPLPIFSQKEQDKLITVKILSQKEKSDKSRIYLLEKIVAKGIFFKESKIFNDYDTLNYCLSNTKLYLALRRSVSNGWGCDYSFLKSKDAEMVVFLSLDSIADANKEIERRMVDNFTYLENNRDEKWQEKVTYYTSQQAKKIFNADSAFKYTFSLPSEFYLKENGKEYKYIEKLFILRKGKSFIDYTCFYTDKAKKCFNKYWKPLEHTLRYKE